MAAIAAGAAIAVATRSSVRRAVSGVEEEQKVFGIEPPLVAAAAMGAAAGCLKHVTGVKLLAPTAAAHGPPVRTWSAEGEERLGMKLPCTVLAGAAVGAGSQGSQEFFEVQRLLLQLLELPLSQPLPVQLLLSLVGL